MGKKQLKWSNFSLENVSGIRDYLHLRNPVGAQNVLNEIRKTAQHLTDFPFVGAAAGKRAGTRAIVLKKYPYKIVYRVSATSITVVSVSVPSAAFSASSIHQAIPALRSAAIHPAQGLPPPNRTHAPIPSQSAPHASLESDRSS